MKILLLVLSFTIIMIFSCSDKETIELSSCDKTNDILDDGFYDNQQILTFYQNTHDKFNNRLKTFGPSDELLFDYQNSLDELRNEFGHETCYGIQEYPNYKFIGGNLILQKATKHVPTPTKAPDLIWSLSDTKTIQKTPFHPTGNLDKSGSYMAKFNTEVGFFEILLFDDLAPLTVENFINLSKMGYYDQTTFHRVIKNFMAQAGDPTGTGTGNPGYKFKDEFHVFARHSSEGMLSMANSGVNSNGSQFFITLEPLPFLDAFDEFNNKKDCLNQSVSCHTVFGKVISGMDIVKKIRLRDPSTDTNSGTLINSIEIIECPNCKTITSQDDLTDPGPIRAQPITK